MASSKNRTMILEYLKENKSTVVTVQDILKYLEINEIKINRSTVYRYLNQLYDENILIKHLDNDEGKTVFKWVDENDDCNRHIHMKCVVCSRIIHLDCGFMEELKIHLKSHDKFNLQCKESVLYGTCENCAI